jgi:hypothetical protein
MTMDFNKDMPTEELSQEALDLLWSSLYYIHTKGNHHCDHHHLRWLRCICWGT